MPLNTTFPLGYFTEKLKLPGAYRSVKKHLYVHRTVLPRESPFRPFYERARAAGWSVHALKCGHHVMLDEPKKTAELLETMA